MCVYIKYKDEYTIIIVWVDDILIVTKCNDNMIHTKNILKQKFKMKDQGKIKYFLGIEFTYEDNIIYMHQKQYLQRLLEKIQHERL